MSTPLPVITGAYNRLVRPPEDPYRISNEPHRDAARQHAANAQRMVLRFCANLTNSGSGTWLSPDVLFTMTQEKAAPGRLIASIKGKPVELIFGVTTENETSDVIFEAFKESLEELSKLFELTYTKTRLDSPSAATTFFPAPQYRARVGSTTATQPIEDRFPWLKMVYELVRLGQTSKALRIIYSYVEDHFKREDLVGLGEVLAEIDLKRLNPQTMTALLRISGRAKRAIPVWCSLLERTKVELQRLNVPDLPGLLVGLGS